MKTAVLAGLAIVPGIIVGGFLGFYLIIAIGVAAGDTGFEGALAMGAAGTGLPLGAIVGAIVAPALVIRARQPDAKPLLSPRGWLIAFGIFAVTGILFAIRLAWITVPEFGSPRPDLFVQVRMPAENAIEDRVGKIWPRYIRAGTYVTPYNEISRTEEDGDVVVTLRYVMVYRVKDRQIGVQYERDKYVYFDLPIGKRPEVTEGYSDWLRPVALRDETDWSNRVTLPLTDDAPDIKVRVKVRWEGR